MKISEERLAVLRTETKNDLLNGETVTVSRIDRLPQRIGGISRTDEGYLTGQAAVAKVGILTYILNDGTTRREFVPPSTLFDTASMETLKMKPVTNNHPPELSLDAKTVKKRKVGATGESVKRDGEFLTTSMTIMDADAIVKVDSGKRELSPGYDCEVLMKPGMYQGERYDAVQVGRKYNHVAICDLARGGPALRLNLDSVSHFDGFELTDESQSNNNNPKPRSRFMAKKRIDGIEYEADQQVINHLDRETARADQAERDLTTKNDQLDKAEAERDSAKDELDKLKKGRQDEIDKAVKARIDLERTATPFLDKESKVDSMSQKEIHLAVIAKAFPEAKLDEKSDAYIEARFDSAIEILSKNDDDDGSNGGGGESNMASQRKKVNGKTKNDGGDGDETKVDSEEAYDRMVKRMQGAHKETKE